MSDTRFVLIGIALIFAGFVVLGAFGQQHYNLMIQAQEFGECFEYKGGTEVEADCSVAMQDRAAFFGLVLSLVGAGVFFLIKGIRGRWDQNVKPEDAVGPGSSFPS